MSKRAAATGVVERPDSAWSNAFLKELLSLGELPHGWDGFGAEPPGQEAIGLAEQVLGALAEAHLRPSRIGASVEGGVTIAFLRSGKYADVECFNTGEMLAATSDRHGKPDVWEVPLGDQEIKRTLERIREHIESPAAPGEDASEWAAA